MDTYAVGDESQSIKNFSYPDFVGLINQWNSPPGAFVTLNKLIHFADITKQSNLIEIGCSTGFSLREISMLTGCSGVGIDISSESVKRAKYNKEKYAPDRDIEFSQHMDQEKNGSFTHVMLGGNLAFFDDPEHALSSSISYLSKNGLLLATPYFQTKEMPEDLQQEMQEVLNIPESSFQPFYYNDVIDLYTKNLTVLYKEEVELRVESEDQINRYCNSVIQKAVDEGSISQENFDSAFNRLLKIRKVINESRKYQKFLILVLLKDDRIFPDVYVPLY